MIDCFITYTTPRTHELINQYRAELPELYDPYGKEVVGPRYCPSIEKKVLKFPQRESHIVWLEREGLNSNLIYPNGLATGLPYDA